MSASRQQSPPKRCYFCGLTGKISKEHAWPQWLGKGAEVEPTQTTRTIGYGRTAEDELTEALNVVVTKPGSVLTTRIREVCERCNSGWMSRLETAAQPLLEHLWQPSYPFGQTTVTPGQALTLATWATKTAWIRDRVSGPNVAATPAMRRYLMDHLAPPEFTRMWIARDQGRSNFGVRTARIQTHHQDDNWDTGRQRHVLLCGMTFHGLSVLVRTDDGWGVPPMTLPESQWRAFWPADEVIQWPPPRPVTDADTVAVTTRYDWLRHPEVSTFNRHPAGIQEIVRN